MSIGSAKRQATLALFGTLSAAVLVAAVWVIQRPPPAADHWALLERYCVDCHNRVDFAADVAFDRLTPDSVPHEREVFESAVRKLRGRMMPPPGRPQPDQAAVDALVAWLEETLDATAEPEPGYVTVHRLNRTEYANEIERLLGLRIDPRTILPKDIESEGFDNIAAVLQVSPTFIDQYIEAARAISLRAIGDPAPKPGYEFYAAPADANQTLHVAGLPLGTRGGLAVTHDFPADGEYELNVHISSKGGSLLRSYPTGWLEYQHRLVLTIDGAEVFSDLLGGEEDLRAVDQRQIEAVTEIQGRFQKIRVSVRAGPRTIGATFVARTFAESDAYLQPLIPGEGVDSVPLITAIDVLGPLQPSGIADTPSRRQIFTCRPRPDEERECAEEIVTRLARQAFRGPVSQADLQTFLSFYEGGFRTDGFEAGIQRAVMAILSSPKFLYRAEALGEEPAPGSVHVLDDVQLASRLSFFLWSQGPDEELLGLAEAGMLSEPDVLRGQVRRMLADPRSSSLVTNFASQWLGLRAIEDIDPDARLFPNFDEDLRHALTREMQLFLDSILRGERSVVELLSADHTFVNERLAYHYGIGNVRGDRFQRVRLEDSNRWGLLGKAAFLLVSSYPDRTSPVLRGGWIMENLLGTPPAAPPPGVETGLEEQPGSAPTTVRERLEAHRVNPSCNQCHGVIDPLGLALENFNAIGEWREIDRYAGIPIEAETELSHGRRLTGPEDLRRELLDRQEQFVQTLTEKLLMYALGRPVEYYDMPVVRHIVREAAGADYRLEPIVLGIVQSDAFRSKRVPPSDAAAADASSVAAVGRAID